MVQRSDRVVVVATGDKLGTRAFARICPSERIQVLVTDTTAPAAALDEFRAAGVTVEIV